MDIELKGLPEATAVMDSLLVNTPKAIQGIVNDVASRGRRKAIAKITSEYYIDGGKVRSAITVKKAGANLEAVIDVKSPVQALSAFNISPDYVPVGTRQTGGVMARVKKGGGGLFPHAFLVRFQSGHLAVVQRAGRKSLPIYEISGPSITGMVSAEDNRTEIEKSIETAAAKAIDAALDSLIGG